MTKLLKDLEIPKNISPEKVKEIIEDWLISWAVSYKSRILIGNLEDGIAFLLTESKDDFVRKVADYQGGSAILDFLQKRKQYGDRPYTSNEIVHHFEGIMSAAAVYRHLKNLVRWKEIRKIELDYGKGLALYEAANSRTLHK